MTSQRDETVGPRADDEMTDDEMTDDEMTDDPIIVERHDEILVSKPVDDAQADDVSMSDRATDYGTGSDELAGRHAAPGTDGPGPAPLVVPPGPVPADEDTPVIPAGDPAAPGWAAASGATAVGATAAGPESDVLETPQTSSLDADSLDSGTPEIGTPEIGTPETGTPETGTPETDIAETSTVDTGTVDTGTPATPGAAPARGLREDGVPAAALAGQQWPAIQAMFVDDPKGSVERAAAAADEAVKAFVASLQREQDALRAAWENDTTTEDLRTALQQYRAFCGRLEGLA